MTKKSYIYEYLLTNDERKLNVRNFNRRDKFAAYGNQNHCYAICGEKFGFDQMHGDHIIPWSKGGKTVPENCQMLCTVYNIKKNNN